MEKKGQVEFIVILGLLIVIAVVVFYASQSGMLSPVVSPDVSTAQDSVSNLIRAGAHQTIISMDLYGGYLDDSSFQLGSLTFNGKQVPYWQKNGEIKYPDIYANFKEGIKQYLAENREGFATAYEEEYGKDLVIGEPTISANFLPDKIDVLVTMPTTLDGSPVPQPYSISIPTRMEEIRDFSTSFMTYSNQNRPLEYFTLASMIISPFDQGVQEVPFILFLLNCGEMVHKNWWDIQPKMDKVIKTTLAHTYMPGKYPQDVIHTTSHPKYSIPPINGKEYQNLDISFHLPDDFTITQSNLQFIPDPIYVYAEPIPMTTLCQSDPVYVKYFLHYPVIVRAKDPLTGNSFQFATEVFIFNNTAGDWAIDSSGFIPSEQKEICENTRCLVDVTVKDSSGDPIPHASVTFMSCGLGTTDSDGKLWRGAPCGAGSLEIQKNSYGKYSQSTATNIQDLTVILYKTPVINLYLHEVIVQDLTTTSQYLIRSDAIGWINTRHPSQRVDMNLLNFDEPVLNQFVFDSKMGIINRIAPDIYTISVSLMTESILTGTIMFNYDITEDMDGQDLHLYIPYMPGIAESENFEDMAVAAVTMNNLLIECGLGPMTTAPIEDFEGCVVAYDEL